jgi:hypothetical protein
MGRGQNPLGRVRVPSSMNALGEGSAVLEGGELIAGPQLLANSGRWARRVAWIRVSWLRPERGAAASVGGEGGVHAEDVAELRTWRSNS